MPGLTGHAIDVIVPTYGSPEYLRACLRALRQSTFQDYRLIVVDDAGPTPALPVVEAEHPGALVLRAARNCGLARAFNRGIEAGSSPFVAFLNDDTEVTPGWLGALVACAERNPRAGSIASKILLQSDRRRFHSAGDEFGTWGMPVNRGIWLNDLGQYDHEEEVFGACAGAALYRRGALEAVRLPSGDIFDGRLWMYLEDVDLAWRLQLDGFTCVYTPEAVVYHHLSATGGGKVASYYVSRNLWHILVRTMPHSLVRANARRIFAYHLRRNARHLRYVKSPEARASLKGTLAGARLAVGSLGFSANTTSHQRERVVRLITHC